MAEEKFLNARCPHCKIRTDLTYNVPLWKSLVYKLRRGLTGGKKKGVRSAKSVTNIAQVKKLQCMSCTRIVLQCSCCKKIIPYVNSGNCPECSAVIA
jgi:hypothetical protein